MRESTTVAARWGRPGLIGGAMALALLPVHLWLDHLRSVELSAVMIAAIGAIYAGFALQRGTLRQMIVELTVASAFFIAALAGLWLTAWIVPAAYVAHGLWDALHHRDHPALTPIPIWYPPFCAVLDWVYAAGLTAIWMTRQ